MFDSIESERFLQRSGQQAFIVMAAFLFPALVASFLRAEDADGAYAVVALQAILVLGCALLAIPWKRWTLTMRINSLVVMCSILAILAAFRNTDPGGAIAFLIVGAAFMACRHSWVVYPFIATVFPVLGILSYSYSGASLNVAASFTLAGAGLATSLALLVRGFISNVSKTAESERELRIERDRALEQLQIEEQRRTAVSQNANISFFNFDYVSGRCYGDAVELARHGLSPDAEFWDVAQDAHLFAPDSQVLMQTQITEMSQQPAGATAQFTLQMRVQPSNELRAFRISGLNVEVDGKLQFAGASIDITDEVQAIEKAKELSSLIELVSRAGGVGLIEFFPDTCTFRCNSEVSGRLGVEHSESERDIELFYAHQTEEVRAIFTTPREALAKSPNGELQSFVHPFYLANGDLHYMRVSRIKRELNGRTSFLGLSLDVTDEVQAKRKAEEQTQQLNLLAMSGAVAYFEVDLERGLIDGNALLKQRAGLPADAPAFPMAEIVSSIPVEARAEFESNVQRAIEAGLGGVTTFEHPYYKHDGELIYVRVTATTQMRHGRLHALGASVEITEAVQARQQAEKQAEQLKLITEQGKIGLYEFDLEKGVMYANSVLCERYGVDPEIGVITQQQLMDRLTEGLREAALAQIEAGKTQPEGCFSTSTIEEASSDGKVRKIRIFEKVERREGRPFYVGASVDVTEEVEAKEKAETAMSKLAQEQDRQAQMYAVIGHELRTPAASLQMMLDDLGEGESLDATLARANIEQLLSVIDTLRAVAQPERMAQSTYDDVQLDEMLQQQAQNFQSMATRHGIQLKTDFTGLTFHPVHIQKTLLRQVVSNLIKNALIHSGGTQLELGASGQLLEGQGKAVRLWIADNGQGVSADKVEKLFEAFVRGSTEAEGTGLGLHICREIIQNMGGDLRYEPRPEGGACFVIELEVDLAKTDRSEQLMPEANESPLKGMRVLVAEDNKNIQMLTRKMLEKQGAEVRVCSDGREALDAFEPGKFDLVLSDIFMPEMNGYELAREIRRVDTAVPLIGLTAATIGKETDEMLAAGATAVLSKPINLARLKDILGEIESSELSG